VPSALNFLILVVYFWPSKVLEKRRGKRKKRRGGKEREGGRKIYLRIIIIDRTDSNHVGYNADPELRLQDISMQGFSESQLRAVITGRPYCVSF
jgi:hypothetical protein